jgi:hypothetical protein
MMMRLGTAQRGKIWGRGEEVLRQSFGKNGRSCRVFVVENHRVYFDIP